MNELVERILDGDKTAVTTFYNLYSKKIYNYAKKKLPRQEDAEELMHDTFLDALDSLPIFQGKSSLSTWLYGIAKHKIADFYRKKKIHYLLLSNLPFLQPIAKEVNQPEFQYEKNKIREGIEQAFHKLSKKYRRIIRLHYEENMPIKEIAIKLDLSFKATESLLFRARQDFKNKYEK
ncbi:MAG: RNA polymerase sigma factor [Patescibacteria group bacterium]|nr:RNA polymerase sigma factor [Patescibacteria group bacterium]